MVTDNDPIRPDLTDARALLDRARHHYAEFEKLLDPGLGLWRMAEAHDPVSGEWCNTLHIDRQRLVAAKPVISDAANNVVSALDHVVAALAKAAGHERLTNLYFPWGASNATFQDRLKKLRPTVGERMTTVIAEARERYQHEVHHLEAVKQISNTGKHWELMLISGSAHGVALNVPGLPQRIFEIPDDTFLSANSFEFYRGRERLTRAPLTIVVGVAVDGLKGSLPRSPTLILPTSFRFVEGVFAAIDGAAP